MRIALVGMVIGLVGCTNASWEKLTTYGGSQHITCYSGGKVIFDGDSDGKVLSENGSDGYYFKHQQTGKLTEVSADCVLVAN